METPLDLIAPEMKRRHPSSGHLAHAHQIAEAISVPSCKTMFRGRLIVSDNDELFFERYKGEFVYIFKYGVVCTYNAGPEEREKVIDEVLPHCKNPLETRLVEKIEICVGNKEDKITYDKVNLAKFHVDALRLIMLHVSQSIALNRYAWISGEILADTEKHTSNLEVNGRLSIGGTKLKKYIGRVLNVKNRISENLYIFDSPEATWEDGELNKLDQHLKATFDLKNRYRSIHDQLEIIKDNLDLFKEITFHRENNRLEWVIIILILVEVMDLLLIKFIN
ncbi:RMD1 family protein [Flagellimonas okinawensis]|uniref:RMD1 family protein n=1 Tax=Flagellimonas okinawensis TaxID=3031324 RepID=A0ABT5XPK1_9FLAO|nr:RMD1 family protein [[Muricauda] okinawensis]MDF0707727.1 RMD1 family protein [[Muricauda] okinawensis]